ncbi:hypothetical protein SLEP1_g29353 [Rubroshorea leprosula]|uniref:Uncharacterized protein n=1 Tax=Rubroshorea leprosula TaxID=152421 RepID=A0AAV5JWP1_9ROSI|nr:hypothetical protein SLEP1_g29353 [Rubroshorea leprosula]
MGLKKGQWTQEEDQILISYIQKHGHGNWRALPKQAGLLRCGKSCRLRWINYLRPDIKRGNFTREEEETIIKLHEMLGNRWSAIAAKLPGRTDNEIKNVWHTHLKKKLKNYQANRPETKQNPDEIITEKEAESAKVVTNSMPNLSPESPQQSSSDFSSVTYASTSAATSEETNNINITESLDYFPEIDEKFWTEGLSSEENSSLQQQPLNLEGVVYDHQFLYKQVPSSSSFMESAAGYGYNYEQNLDDGMGFWYDLLIRAEHEQQLTEF